jgi:hypothetical protein
MRRIGASVMGRNSKKKAREARAGDAGGTEIKNPLSLHRGRAGEFMQTIMEAETKRPAQRRAFMDF